MTHKNVLVTGAAGHTGTYLVKSLIKSGYKITATDLKPVERKKLMTKETIYSNELKFEIPKASSV